MKIQGVVITILIFCATVVRAQFIHPGMSHSQSDLELVKEKIQAKEEPWFGYWQQLRRSPLASLKSRPSPRKIVARGPYNKPDIDATEFLTDGEVAYTMALQWYMTGQKKYAEKTIEILNAWSNVLDSVVNHDRQLLIGMAGIKYLNAAEIIRHTDSGWQPADMEQFKSMLLDVWYPVIRDFVPRYNGNWDAAIGQTMMCIGIFLDRRDIFDRAFNHLLKGDTNGAICNYLMPNGQCQESGRDQAHTQMGLGYLGSACEIAWHQGRDLYSAYDCRLATGLEYTARFMLGEEVPHQQYIAWYGAPVYGPGISQEGRGTFLPIYARIYRHYHDRMGMEMPYTSQIVERYRPEDNNTAFMPWTTLMYCGLPAIP